MSVNVRAYVVSGRGKALISRSEDIAKLSASLGQELIDGSLNLVSTKPLWLDADAAIFTSDKKGHLYWHGLLNGREIILNRWRGDCPAHIYEVYSEVYLREKFDLKDGDEVNLTIDENIIDNDKGNNFIYRLTWFIIWSFRENLYYKSDRYLKWLKRAPIKGYAWRAVQK